MLRLQLNPPIYTIATVFETGIKPTVFGVDILRIIYIYKTYFKNIYQSPLSRLPEKMGESFMLW